MMIWFENTKNYFKSICENSALIDCINYFASTQSKPTKIVVLSEKSNANLLSKLSFENVLLTFSGRLFSTFDARCLKR